MTEESKNKTPLFLFDFDGVIVDSLDEATTTFNAFFNSLGLANVTKKQSRDLYTNNVYDSLLDHGVKEDQFHLLLEMIEKRNKYGNKKVKLYANVGRLLEVLKDYNLYVITSSSTKAVKTFLRKKDLLIYFKDVLGADKGISKVDKIQAILKKEKADSQQTYFVTDTTGDLIEAKTAGVKTIAVGWGYHNTERLKKENPDIIFESIDEFIKAIPGL
ncbi:HAD family hydrolase [Patescibacteria group bacterium]|nr:HAD family hydrolase [Patescibacteria group bacterium]MBU1074923.1 HAD family hydrolase [Patescibacteria group bacterium]MBU1952466.1 HAD family hydrolase [Patescibacteria group bacterium]